MGRGGACVPARVVPQGRIHRSTPTHNAYVFGMETSLNSPRTMRVLVGMETPLRGRSGGHVGTAPTVSFRQITRGRLISFGGLCVNGYFICVGLCGKI